MSETCEKAETAGGRLLEVDVWIVGLVRKV